MAEEEVWVSEPAARCVLFLPARTRSRLQTACVPLFTHKGASQVQKERIARDKGGHWRIPFVRVAQPNSTWAQGIFVLSACTTSAFLPLNRETMMLLLHLQARKHTGSSSGENWRTSAFPRHRRRHRMREEEGTCVNVSRADQPVVWPPHVCSDFFHYLLVKPQAAPFATWPDVSRGRQMLQLCTHICKKSQQRRCNK